jgi:hypothetical protein
VFRPEWSSSFRRLNKERAYGKRHLSVVRGMLAAAFVAAGIRPRIGFPLTKERRSGVVLPKIGFFQGLFDVECRDGERANHLEREKADDISGIIVGFEVEMGW